FFSVTMARRPTMPQSSPREPPMSRNRRASGLTKFKCKADKFLPSGHGRKPAASRGWVHFPMRRAASAACLSLTGVSLALSAVSAAADYRITRDYGGLVDQYKAKYVMLRDRGERVVIDGICNSACTLVLGIVPLSRICVTPNASLGFHQAYYDKRWTFGLRVTSASATDDMMAV